MERIYECGICGKEYAAIEGRINCETTCLAKQKEAEEFARKQKLEEEKEVRKAVIEEKCEEVLRLMRSYMRDYGTIKLSTFSDSDSTSRASDFNLFGKWWM